MPPSQLASKAGKMSKNASWNRHIHVNVGPNGIIEECIKQHTHLDETVSHREGGQQHPDVLQALVSFTRGIHSSHDE